MEECTYFWGVNTSWGINTAESKIPLNQEDNQAPQPTQWSRLIHYAEINDCDTSEATHTFFSGETV
jgi:hypothetical protein